MAKSRYTRTGSSTLSTVAVVASLTRLVAWGIAAVFTAGDDSANWREWCSPDAERVQARAPGGDPVGGDVVGAHSAVPSSPG